MNNMETTHNIIDPLELMLVMDQRNEGLYGLEQIIRRADTVLESRPTNADQAVASIVGTLAVIRLIAKNTIDNIHEMDKQR